jgi:3-isopropylmalate/(R)-2-methylmalate dehydratase small subunit
MIKQKTIFREIRGRAIPLPGDEIDTDRIIPARFLKTITFEDIGQHVFYDERFDADGKEKPHPLNDPRFRGGSVLLVNGNFGCGSSREHAPQALMGFGIRAFVGESFAEIFAGNCTALGLPAVRVARPVIDALMKGAEDAPADEIVIDLEKKTVTRGNATYGCDLPEANRLSFLLGTWDTLDVLLAHKNEIGVKARTIPYLNGFFRE